MHPNLCVWRAVNQLTVYYWGSIVAMAQLWEPLWHVSHNLTYDRDKAKGWILLHTGRRKETRYCTMSVPWDVNRARKCVKSGRTGRSLCSLFLCASMCSVSAVGVVNVTADCQRPDGARCVPSHLTSLSALSTDLWPGVTLRWELMMCSNHFMKHTHQADKGNVSLFWLLKQENTKQLQNDFWVFSNSFLYLWG